MRSSLVILALMIAFYVEAQDSSDGDGGFIHLGFSTGQATYRSSNFQQLSANSFNPVIEIGKTGKVNIGGLFLINPNNLGDSLFRVAGSFELGYALEQSFANDKFYFKEGVNVTIPFSSGYRFYGQLGVKAENVGVDFNIQLSQMILPGFYNPLLMQFGIRFTGR